MPQMCSLYVKLSMVFIVLLSIQSYRVPFMNFCLHLYLVKLCCVAILCVLDLNFFFQ